MKMPRRPFYLPIVPQPDIFGLERLTILGEACETCTERQQRISKVEAGVVAAFKVAATHLGEEQARQLFAKVARRPKRGRGKALAPDRDFRLLKAYDEMQPGGTIAALGRRLRASGIDLGNTADAIALRIRTLVAERKQTRHAAAVEARRWRMATRNERPTILSAAMAKK
jgi:hypothetical protein